ncbi:hypothetical protein [Georgenia daeguensis]|uniref:AbiEi antitoxin C-terminal domain-containing protein n=1 Tax=Georgenia daeguensis TaxID=908355 RepID=A0ABP6UKN2_9MICO
MRRAYIEAHVDLERSLALAVKWAGRRASLHVPSTRSVHAFPLLAQLGLSITSPSAKSKYYGPPRGMVIAWCLGVEHMINIEQSHAIDGVVVVRAHGAIEFAEGAANHAPWVTAYDVERLAGEVIRHVPEAPAPVKAAMKGTTGLAVPNQGLIDNRDRAPVVHALTHLRDHGVRLDPDEVMVEALRNGWGGDGPVEVREIVRDLNRGRRLRYDTDRILPERLQEWLNA